MKAAVQTRYGPPEVVLISEADKPATGDNEVLVRVHATMVNRADCACRAARPFFMRLFTGLIRPRAAVLGNEFAGVVEAVGSGVTSFGVGRRARRFCPRAEASLDRRPPERSALRTLVRPRLRGVDAD